VDVIPHAYPDSQKLVFILLLMNLQHFALSQKTPEFFITQLPQCNNDCDTKPDMKSFSSPPSN
jgi:hypothetical protein